MKINQEHETEVIKKSLKLNQENWINHFNKKKLKMISAPDIYLAIKRKDKALKSIKQDLIDSYIVTSTRIDYSKNTITHDADSKVVKPKTIKVDIPIYWNETKSDKQTEKYLQALFDTKDSIKEILSTLKSLDSSKKTWLYTPSKSNRKSRPFRSVRLYFSGRFDVYGYLWVGYNYGLSRGVNINSASKKQSKKRK